MRHQSHATHRILGHQGICQDRDAVFLAAHEVAGTWEVALALIEVALSFLAWGRAGHLGWSCKRIHGEELHAMREYVFLWGSQDTLAFTQTAKHLDALSAGCLRVRVNCWSFTRVLVEIALEYSKPILL